MRACIRWQCHLLSLLECAGNKNSNQCFTKHARRHGRSSPASSFNRWLAQSASGLSQHCRHGLQQAAVAKLLLSLFLCFFSCEALIASEHCLSSHISHKRTGFSAWAAWQHSALALGTRMPWACLAAAAGRSQDLAPLHLSGWRSFRSSHDYTNCSNPCLALGPCSCAANA